MSATPKPSHCSSASAKIGENTSNAFQQRPEWMRVKEACAFSRLSKPKLYDLMNRGLIKSVSLRERGMVRGTRLVSSDSLRAFLESRASGGETQAL